MNKKISFVLMLAIGLAIVFGALVLLIPNHAPQTYYDNLKKFNSLDEIKTFLKANSINYGFRYNREFISSFDSVESVSTEQAKDSASSYSRTNIQVEGVDESDVIKNDGEYIYSIFNNVLTISKVYPASEMKLLYQENISGANSLFLNENKLIVFSNGYKQDPSLGKIACPDYYGECGYYRTYTTEVLVYDITDRTSPKLLNNVSFDGYYVNSRMIDNKVYIISSKYANQDYPYPPVYSINGDERAIDASEIYYFPHPDSSYVFNMISSIDLDSYDVKTKVYLSGNSNNIYVSQDNIYLTYMKRFDYLQYNKNLIDKVYLAISNPELKEKLIEIDNKEIDIYSKLAEMQQAVLDFSKSLTGDEKSSFDIEFANKLQNFQEEMAKEREKTVLNKISIKDLNYIASGEVPGTVLNQFSMDEYEGNFRVATTLGSNWWSSRSRNSTNNLYVLNPEMEVLGSVENLASGERIYSVRFIGEKAYITTFRQIDPLFVIDVSNPKAPKVLGYLKITGFSNYLHPYDDTHLLGIGNEASEEGRIEGMKVTLFDVSDFQNPKEVSSIQIGDRGTYSEANYDHKAFLFDKEKGILIIPVSIAEAQGEEWGTLTWQGAYLIDIDLEGLFLRGKISHTEAVERLKPASEEPIGVIRENYGQKWIKVEMASEFHEGIWKLNETSPENHYYNTRYDSDIDYFKNGAKDRSYLYDDKTQIKRSVLMDNVIYTLSPSKIKANDLSSLKEINSMALPYTEQAGTPIAI